MNGNKQLAITAAALLLMVGVAFAADLPEKVTVKGRFFAVSQIVGSYDLPNAGTVQRTKSSGMFATEDPENALNLNSATCIGTTVMDADGNEMSGAGYCDGVDADGDTWILWWDDSGTGGDWGFMAGTGKFAGIEGGGTWQEEFAAADDHFSNTFEGSWETKTT